MIDCTFTKSPRGLKLAGGAHGCSLGLLPRTNGQAQSKIMGLANCVLASNCVNLKLKCRQYMSVFLSDTEGHERYCNIQGKCERTDVHIYQETNTNNNNKKGTVHTRSRLCTGTILELMRTPPQPRQFSFFI